MRRRGFVIVLSASALAAAVSAVPAGAVQAGQPTGQPRVDDRVPVESLGDTASGGQDSVSVRSGAPRRAGAGIETGHRTSTIAPGLELTEFDRFEPEGWVRGDVLSAELATPGLVPQYLRPATASQPTPLSDQAQRSGAVAGVNGDFFDIGATGAPLGVGVSDGKVMHSPAQGHNEVAAIGGSGQLGRLMQVFLDANFTRADGSSSTVTDLNSPKVSAGGIGLYTPFWGPGSRTGAVEGARRVTDVELVDGVVTRIAPAPIDGPVSPRSVRLLGVDAGADLLSGLRMGEHVDVAYQPRTDGQAPQVAVGGNKVLLRDGVTEPVDDRTLHPRTAAGFSADGTRMWLVTIDGRQADSRGMTEWELADQLRALGADDAINLDGGGSSTLLARDQGDQAPAVRNSPADGEQRPVPNGIGFALAAGSGRLTGFRVEPEVPCDTSNRVLSGLTRKFNAFGHDESGAPVSADPVWAVPPASGRVDEGGVFRAGQPGRARVTANSAGVRGEADVSVLGPLAALSTSDETVALAGKGSQERFQVLGSDDHGFGTWVQPSDVHLEYDSEQLRITPDADGFLVTALSPSASSAVTVHVGGHVTHLGVTAGSEQRQLSSLDGPAGWNASVHPESVRASLQEAPGHAGTPGLALDYALTGSTVTRAAYVNANQPMNLPGGTQKLGMWVNGDGKGAWLRYTIAESNGVRTTVDLARHVDWTGWRYVEAPLPPGISGPAQLQRLYAVESDGARQYEGRLVFDDLTVAVAPEAAVPEDPEPRDPAVVQDGSLPPESGGQRIAVVSDAQFTADDPDGPMVQQARRSLREAVAAKPDRVVINGDFVDRGTAADFDLARRIIDSEVGDRVPWHYVPGNHETYGPGDTSEFSAEFGPAHQVVDVPGTRMFMLDSSAGSLREGGFDQVKQLRAALTSAADDPRIKSVAIFLHHPMDDPAPGDASQLSDRKEADLLRDWVADFERTSGKPGVVVAAHAGMFHASTVDGVEYPVSGNSGKAPAVAPEHGGFTGWSLLRIAPEDHARSVGWETHPHVDDMRLFDPGEVRVGAPAPVRAEVVQGDRIVPVAYPVSADWFGSREVHIGRPEGADPDRVAAFDPATGEVVGLRPGRGTLSVVVNKVKRTIPIVVTQ